MKRIIVVALAVLGVCIAATASASAHEFHASKTGKLLGLSEGNQVFTTGNGQTITCKHAATTGTITALLSLHQSVTVVYSSCTGLFGTTATVSPAQYLLSADGLVGIASTIILSVKSIVGSCTITVHPQDIGTVKYKTDPSNSGAILEESKVENIFSLSSGEPCGPKGASIGEYAGNNLVFEDGGSISWT